MADIVLAIHEGRHRHLEPKATPLTSWAGLRDAVFATALLSNNLPDLDFLYAGITQGKLGYLLHHRGHTHTLIAVPALACVAAALGTGWALLVARLRSRYGPSEFARSRPPYLVLWLVGILGGLLHVGMDFENNYGVHPFWPLDNHWYYGDTIFIVDPWLIVGWCAVAWTAAKARVSKGVLVLIVVGVVTLASAVDEVPRPVPWLLAALAVVGFASLRRSTRRQRLWAAGLFTTALFGCLTAGRQASRATLDRALSVDARAITLDVVSTPFPGNPFCWWLIAVQRVQEDYVVRQALVAPFAGLSSVAHCSQPAHGSTAPLEPVPPTFTRSKLHDGRLVWLEQFRAPIADLTELVRQQCQVAAFVRYARVPFWTHSANANIVGDLRYDRDAGIGFAEITSNASADCPRWVPPWSPPREALIE